MPKLLATGDIHLRASVEKYGTERLADQERVLNQIADLARTERVDALLLAGDIFEHRHPQPDALHVFRRFLGRLPAALPIIAIPGNGRHDGNYPEQELALGLFDDRINVLHREPGLAKIGRLEVATLPWVSDSWLASQVGGGDRDSLYELAAEHLLTVARGLRAQASDDAVLMLHWSISGASLPTGLPVEMAREPILSVHELEAMNWRAVIAGHIHRPQLLGSENAAGPMLYVGSPLPLDFGEAGFEHGCWLLEVDTLAQGVGMAAAEFLPLESRRFITYDHDVNVTPSAAMHHPDMQDAIIRVRYQATEEQARRIDKTALRQQLLDAGAWRVYIQEEIVRETRARAAGLDESVAEGDAFEMWLDANAVGEATRARLRVRHERYATEVGA